MGGMAVWEEAQGSLNSLPSAMGGETEAQREGRARLRSSSESVAVWPDAGSLTTGDPPLPSLSSWGGAASSRAWPARTRSLQPLHWVVGSPSRPWARVPVYHIPVALPR